jgi:hypothetical protein
VDDFAAEIVKAIFEYKLFGYNEQQIANMLNANGTHSPAEYKKASGLAYSTPFAINKKSLWTANAIRRILTNRVYIGTLEQGKRTKASYRVKKYFYQPREAWSIHENNHDPIVSKLDFELVQELMARDTKVSVSTGQLQLFSGLIICGICNQPMTIKTIKKKSGKSYINYICATHKRYGTCKNNNVSSIKLEEYALLSIQKQIEGLLSADEITKGVGLDELRSRKKSAIEDMIEKTLHSIQKYNDYLVKSLTHMVDGIISQEEYELFRGDFRQKVEDAEKYVSCLQDEIDRLTRESNNNELIEQFKAHRNIVSLDRRIVVSFIHSIVVCDNKDIRIRLRYNDEFDIPAPFLQERAVV